MPKLLLPLNDRNRFRTAAPAELKFLKHPVAFVNTFGSDRTVNFAKTCNDS